MNGIGKRLRQLRKAKGWTQEQLASACGWEGNGRISNYEKAIREPGLDDIRLMAEALGVSQSELFASPDAPTKLGNANGIPEHPVSHDVPVIELATLAVVGSGNDPSQRTMTVQSWTICPVKHGPNTFCTQILDDSMACMDARAIHKGAWVHADPDQSPTHDQAVVARLDSGAVVIAQYMEQAGRKWLHLLNSAYPPLPNAFELLGRVIYVAVER